MNTAREQRWDEKLEQIVKLKDLYGRSFTRGVALFYAASESRLEEDLEDELDFELHKYFGETFYRELAVKDCSTEARYIVHIMDLATLDRIARYLCGELWEEK